LGGFFWEAFSLFLNGDAHCGLKPARGRCGVFFTKKRMRHEIPQEPARRGSHISAGAPPPARKAQGHETHEKESRFFKHKQNI
jgi:hypothetical protein